MNIKSNQMNKLLIFLIILLNITCSNGQEAVKISSQSLIHKPVTEPYSISLNVERLNDSIYSLYAKINIDSISYMMPIVNKTMTGIFKIDFLDSSVINSNYKLIEKACPVVVNYIWSNPPHKVIKGKVEYIQKFSIHRPTDFVSKGLIQFVIEPRCTLEKFEFTLSYEAGEMNVKLD